MKSWQKGSEAKRVSIVVTECPTFEKAIEVAHLTLAALALLSHDIRRRLRIHVKALGKGFELIINADTDRIKGLNADYYTGKGLLLASLRKGGFKGLRVRLKRNGDSAGIHNGNVVILFLALSLGLREAVDIEYSIPCDSRYAFMLAAAIIDAEVKSGVE